MDKAFFIQGINLFFAIIFWLIFARCLCTFFHNINWYNQPFKALKEITDPILEPFRKIVPPLGGWDFSPLAAWVAIGILQYIIIIIIAMV